MNRSRYRVARRMAHVQPFHVMDLLARARAREAQGHDVIHMEIGEPDLPTPAPIVEAGCRALREGRTHYTPAVGLAELREAIAGHYADRFDARIEPERIIVTPGSSGALQLVLSVIVDAGQEVLLADPGYPCNRHFVHLVEGVPVSVPVSAQDDYQLTSGQVERAWTDNTRAAMIATPSNPTGTCIGREALQRLHEAVVARGGDLVIDEIYQGLVYDTEPRSILQWTDDAFVINSFSKYFGMTGWRLGWLVAPPAYVRDLDKLAQNIFLAASTPAQYAALAAFESESLEILEARRAQFRDRRDFLLPALRKLGFGIPATPQGAFYLYADCSAFTDDSYRFALGLLEGANVAITPGIDFGSHLASRHVRFACTTDIERLREGVERIASFLNSGQGAQRL